MLGVIKRQVGPRLDNWFRDRHRRDTLELCRACQSPTDPLKMAHGRFWFECPSCGFLQAEIATDFYRDMQNGEGFAAGTGVGGGGFREYWIAKLCVERLRLGRVLLYGTGNSPTFGQLRGEGVEAYGCDISRDLITARQSEYGADTFFHVEQFPATRFGAIVAVEVFEHLTGPLQTLHALMEHLDDGGVIAGTTDLHDGSDIAGHIYLEPSVHVAYWSPRSLAAIGRRFSLDLALFQLVCPGSVKADEKYGLLWPRKRVFFLHPPQHREFFRELKESTPILPIDRP